jgi:hypothetical protein
VSQVHIIRELEKRRGERTWGVVAAEIGCTESHLSEVRSGKRAPGPKIREYLGVIRKVIYVKATENGRSESPR